MPVPRHNSLFLVFHLGLIFGSLSVEAFAPNNNNGRLLDLSRIGQGSFQSSRTFKYRGLPSAPTDESLPSHIPADSQNQVDPTAPKVKKLTVYNLPKRAYRVYKDYAKRLWRETDVSAREKIADDKIRGSIRAMQQVLLSNEYARLPAKSEDAKMKLIEACRSMEDAIKMETSEVAVPEKSVEKAGPALPAKKEKKQRSVLFGALMGAAVACWVFSGNYIFTGLFTLMTVLGQLEYYRMIMNTGVSPARRISVVGACSMFLTALFAPNLHQICLPMFGLYTMIWFLATRRQYSTIPEIATTFTGMFYLGYVPSFWVRVRLIGSNMEPTRLFALLAPAREYMKSQFGVPVPERFFVYPITTGAVFIFWSWISLAFSDVGAYFVGRKYGKTKLGEIAPAAGATSPNKSVEGVIGGCAVSAGLSILGAWVQKWPYFWATGAVHGVLLGLLGLIGDLTASMLKRDSGLKDFGDLIPEHGGILDRVDSFIWTAPYSWIVCAYILPALKAFSLR